MYVKLPEGRDYSGEEIVDAFKRAAAFEKSPEKRWVACEANWETQYEAGSVQETVRKMGAWAYPQTLKKRWIWWGEMVWWSNGTSDKTPGFALEPLFYQSRHSGVDVSVSMGQSGSFNKVRPRFEKFLARFFKELENPQAAAISPRAP